MKILSKTLDGDDAGEIDLKDEIFALEPRADILHTIINWQLAKRRGGNRRILTRAEVNRTGKKLYKQKGTGNARHGPASVSQFRGGAKTMGPVVRSHAYDLPKKVRALGLKHALSTKAATGKLVIIENEAVTEAKTKKLAAQFGKLGLSSALVIGGATLDAGFVRASKNLPKFDVLPVAGINVYDIIRRDTLVLTKAAVTAIEERLA
jgi:large subunit ribosomal protein L4